MKLRRGSQGNPTQPRSPSRRHLQVCSSAKLQGRRGQLSVPSHYRTPASRFLLPYPPLDRVAHCLLSSWKPTTPRSSRLLRLCCLRLLPCVLPRLSPILVFILFYLLVEVYGRKMFFRVGLFKTWVPSLLITERFFFRKGWPFVSVGRNQKGRDSLNSQLNCST